MYKIEDFQLDIKTNIFLFKQWSKYVHNQSPLVLSEQPVISTSVSITAMLHFVATQILWNQMKHYAR